MLSTRELLARLVAFDSTSCNSNLALINFVRDYLDGYGIDSLLVHDETGVKANLYATIGPNDQAGVMLSGHTDVVPVTGQNWDSDPFQLQERDGLLYGRGTSDMKGFLAAALAAVPAMRQGLLHTPIHLAFSYDEEVGCLGARRLIEVLAEQPVQPTMGIIGEPTGMQVVTAHKGKQAMRVDVDGHACHSAYITEGVNAVEYAAELIAYIRRLNRHIAQQGIRDDGYRVPHTTLQVGTVQGGIAINIVPAHCRFEFEIRNLPQEDAQEWAADIQRYANEHLVPEMHNVAAESGFRFTTLSNYPGLHTEPGEHIITFAQSLLTDQADTSKVSFGTEGGLFTGQLGVPVVVCGPGHIDQAHKPNEFISLEQLQTCDDFIQRLLNRLSTR